MDSPGEVAIDGGVVLRDPSADDCGSDDRDGLERSGSGLDVVQLVSKL